MEAQKMNYKNIRAQRARARRQKKQHRMGMICVSCIVGILLLTMSVQIVELREKGKVYRAQEEELIVQLQGEEERREEIRLYGEHVKTREYIEEVAKSKLGLVYPNEIVFKEQSR